MTPHVIYSTFRAAWHSSIAYLFGTARPMPFLDWVNKAQAQRTTADVPYHLLQVQSAHGAPQSRKLIASFNG
jgi:hypothetical protein